MLVLSTVVYVGGLFVLFLKADFLTIIGDSLQASLKEVAEHVSPFRFGFISAAAGVILTLLGLAMLTLLLIKAGDRAISQLSLILYFFGAVLWVMVMILAVSAAVWAAHETVRDGAVPSYYRALSSFGTALEQFYTFLAFLAIAGYGWSILVTAFLPAWIGWASLGWGLFWLAVFVLTKFDSIPVLHHIMPLVIGLYLIFQG